MLDSPGFDKDELAKVLDALPDDGWVVDEELSRTQYETTQIVHRDKGVVRSKYVRKVFAPDAGLGAAYRHVLAAQASGKRFEHIPLVYDMVETDEGVAVVTEFVQGKTLRQYVEEVGCGKNVALFAAEQLCDALVELHEGLPEPVVHRDLKPSNMVVTNGKLMLIDLGIARTWHAGGARDTVLLGTPGYAPPEQFGYGQTTPQSDIYAAGMVMAYCLTGEDPTPALRESGFVDPRIPKMLRPVLVKATALEASQRFASARDMKAAVEQARRLTANSPRQAAPGAASGPAPAAVSDSGSASASAARAAATTAVPRAEQEQSNRRLRFPNIPRAVGMVWNVLLAIAWVFLTGCSLYTSIVGGTEFLDRLPIWHRLFEYLALIIVPSGLLAVLLCDKRRLKEHFPILACYTWPQLALRSLGIVVVLYTVAIAAQLVLFGVQT